MARYAENTAVSVDRSRTEIERNLARFGASGFGYAWDTHRRQEQVIFQYGGKQVRVELAYPQAPNTTRTAEAWVEKERRRRWRALTMCIKAKLVAVDDGILTFEEEFLSYFVTPDGFTVGEKVLPMLEAAAKRGVLPALTGRPG